MALSPATQNAALRLPQQDFAQPRLGGPLGGMQGPMQQLKNLEQFLDGAAKFFQAMGQLQQKLGQMQQLKSGSPVGGKSPLMGSSPLGGSTAGQGATGKAAPSPFETSSFTPAAGKAPVELNPSSAPVSAGGAGGSGEATLGGGLPPALAQYKGAIESAAQKAGVPANMLAGQIWQESRGNLSAVSTNGGNGLTDTGLMQVNPNTFQELQAKHPELQGKNLSDPETNILAGAFYMKDMKEDFGSWDLALRAYNSGPNGVDLGNPDAIPAGTGDATYVQKVKQFWNTIETGNGSLPA